MRPMVIFILSVLFFSLSVGAQATSVKILDPEGNSKLFLGGEDFHSRDIEIEQDKKYLVVRVKSSYVDFFWDNEYNRADLRILFNSEQDNLSVKMAHSSQFGLIRLNSAWTTSAIFSSLDIPYGKYENGSFIPVQARGGVQIGEAEIERKEGNELIIKISLDILRQLPGFGGWITIEWATALCGNSVVRERFFVIFPPLFPDKPDGLPGRPVFVDGLDGKSTLPSTLLLLASGLAGLLACRRLKR